MNPTLQLVTFRVGPHVFGVDVMKVQEVLRAQGMTVVPLAHQAVSGLVNLRGQIVTALEMRERLGLPPRDDASTAMNVIVRTRDGAVSLLVDDIGDVIDSDAAHHEAVPATVDAHLRSLLSGVEQLDQALLLILDPDCAAELAPLNL